MAEQAQAAAEAVKDTVNQVTQKVGELTTGENAPTLYKDEVTGEMVSKTERGYLSGKRQTSCTLTGHSQETPEAA